MAAAKVSYTVERVAPATVRDELGRLWDDNLQVEGGVDRKFDWLYVDAPEKPDGVWLLAAQQGADRRWVGTAGAGLRRFRVLGSEMRAAVLADLAVDREHRSVLPALALVRAVKAWALAECDFAYGFPNGHAEGVFRRVGYQALGTTGRWVRVLRHAPYVSRIKQTPLPRVPGAVRRVVDRAADIKAIAAVAGGAVDLVRLGQLAPSLVLAARKVKLSWLPAADDRFDRIWQSARDEYDIVGVRSSTFLRWRFPASERISIALATARDGDAPVAYAVIEQTGDIAEVRDLFGKKDAIVALLDLLVPALYPRGAGALSMRYLGAPWLRDALESRGWSRRPSDRVVTLGIADRITAQPRAALTAVSRWHLTDADEDM